MSPVVRDRYRDMANAGTPLTSEMWTASRHDVGGGDVGGGDVEVVAGTRMFRCRLSQGENNLSELGLHDWTVAAGEISPASSVVGRGFPLKSE